MKKLLFLVPLLFLNQGCATLIMAGSTVSTGVLALNLMADRRTTGIAQEDERIIKQLVETLKKDPEITAQVRAQVYSYNKIVLLAGEAPTQQLIDKTTHLATTVAGIRKIYSYFELMPAISKQDQEVDSHLRMLLNSALFMSHGYTAMHPHLTVENAIVYVMGLLTRDEADKIINTIQQFQGIRRVVPLIEYVKERA